MIFVWLFLSFLLLFIGVAVSHRTFGCYIALSNSNILMLWIKMIKPQFFCIFFLCSLSENGIWHNIEWVREKEILLLLFAAGVGNDEYRQFN